MRFTRDKQPQVPTIRRDAMKAVAENRGVTLDTIRDACVRRLSPDVTGVLEFDAMLEEWLHGRSHRMKQVLYRHQIDRGDGPLIDGFFKN